MEWQRFKPDILKYAESKPALGDLLSSVSNDFDEGKSQRSFFAADFQVNAQEISSKSCIHIHLSYFCTLCLRNQVVTMKALSLVVIITERA